MHMTNETDKEAASSKKNLIKKIVKGPPPEKLLSMVPQQDWEALQEILRAKISADLRGQLTIVTMMLAQSSPAGRETTTVKKVTKSIEGWQRKTRLFLRQIWEAPPQLRPNKITKKFLSRRFQKLPASMDLQPYLSFLASVIDGALLASEYVIQKINRLDFPGTREHDLWMIWVALVVTLLMEDKIKVTRVTKRRQELKPEFVKFIDALQKYLPKQVQSRTTRESLLKGLNETELITGKIGFDHLLEMMVVWGLFSLVDFSPAGRDSSPAKFGWAVASAPFNSRLKKLRQLRKATKQDRHK
jgi:hypothetical protein